MAYLFAGFLFFFSIAIAVITLIKQESLSAEVNRLRRRIDELENADSAIAVRRKAARAETSEAPALSAATPAAQAVHREPMTPPRDTAPHRPAQKQAVSAPGKRDSVIENWTGIIGSILFVLGAGFLAVFAAIGMSPGYRFILMVFLSVILLVISFFFRNSEKWPRLSGWIRSISGALFLLACLGAGHISALKWIDSSAAALFILIAGIMYNLILAASARLQGLAAFHTIIPIAALMATPVSLPALIAASVLALTGVLLTYREPWGVHLALTAFAYAAYQVHFFAIRDAVIPFSLEVAGVIALLAVLIPAALNPYRHQFSGRFDIQAFIAHLGVWLSLACGLWAHTLDFMLAPVLLLAGAVITLFLARRARAMGIRWLFATDAAAALLLSYAAIFSAFRWEFSPGVYAAAWLLLTSLFAAVMVLEDEHTFGIIALGVQAASSIAAYFIFAGMDETALLAPGPVSVLLGTLGGVMGSTIATRRFSERADGYSSGLVFSDIAGFTTSLMPIALLFQLEGVSGLSWTICGFAVLLTIFLFSTTSRGLYLGTALFVLAFSVHGWMNFSESGFTATLTYALPYAAASALPALVSLGRRISTPLSTIVFSVIMMNYLFFGHHAMKSFSPILPGFIWLASAFVLYIAPSLFDRLASKRSSFSVWTTVLLIAFFVHHFSITAQHTGTISWLLALPTRHFSSGAGIITIAFLAWRGRYSDRETAHQFIESVMTEALAAFIGLTVLFEFVPGWRATGWALAALFFCMFGRRYGGHLIRLALYAFIASAISALAVIFAPSPSISLDGFNSAATGGLSALILLGLFITACLRITPPEEANRATLTATISRVIAGKLEPGIYAIVILPLWFFLWRALPSTVVTLGWVSTAFGIFILAIFRHNSQLRIASIVLVAISLVRIIFVDLVGGSILVKAIVFMGSGGIMIAMNTVYNRFRSYFNPRL